MGAPPLALVEEAAALLLDWAEAASLEAALSGDAGSAPAPALELFAGLAAALPSFSIFRERDFIVVSAPVPTVASMAAAVSSACLRFPQAAGEGVGNKLSVACGD